MEQMFVAALTVSGHIFCRRLMTTSESCAREEKLSWAEAVALNSEAALRYAEKQVFRGF